jgi:hypothetical protein
VVGIAGETVGYPSMENCGTAPGDVWR